MSQESFMSSLNAEQRKAVETLYGPVMVIAGPGTGKTHMLVHRIAHMLSVGADIQPNNVLCLTFTENAAVEMHQRLARLIGPTAYQVKIHTFHGFCQWIMDSHPDVFHDQIQHKKIAEDLDKALVFQKVITAKKWEYFSSVWDELWARQDILQAISQLKRESFSPEELRSKIPTEKIRLEADPGNFYLRDRGDHKKGDFKPNAREKIDKKIAKIYELCDIWEDYENELHRQQYYDFDDQINWVCHALKQNESLRLDLQEQFQWLLADEFQDTNNSQNQILTSLTQDIDSPNIFVVGDDDQSIYRFQGASMQNILDFKTHFPEHISVVLDKNYRSQKDILQLATKLIAHSSERVIPDKKLIADENKDHLPSDIRQHIFESEISESKFLAKKIQNYIAEGIAPENIAILLRRNKDIPIIAKELQLFGVRVVADIFENIFEDEWVRRLIILLETFLQPQESAGIFEILHSPHWKIEPKVLFSFSQQRYEERKNFAKIFLETPNLDPQLEIFFTFFCQARKDYAHLRPAALVEKLFYQSGMAEYISDFTKTDNQKSWQCILKFIDWIRRENEDKPENILKKIELHHRLNLRIAPDPVPMDKRSVRLMTIHKSKGMEFDVVFMPRIIEKKWEKFSNPSKVPLPDIFTHEDATAEERRLFFVGLTRARNSLLLSYPQNDFAGKPRNASIFWHEMGETYLNETETKNIESELAEFLPIFTQHQEKTLTKSEREKIEPLVRDFTWSASALNNFLFCPRKFLYQNLYRAPQRSLPQTSYGIAIHQALERFFRAEKIQQTEEKILAEYQHALRGQNLDRASYEEILIYGQENLGKYFREKIAIQEFLYGTETEFDFNQFHPRLDGISITGRADRIDYLDAEKKFAKIIDYKSGKKRTIKTGDNYWRQLVFYKLLSEQSVGVKFEVQECCIDFIKPNEKKTFDMVSFQTSEEDLDQLKSELRQAHESLQNIEFPPANRDTLTEEQIIEVEYWENFG